MLVGQNIPRARFGGSEKRIRASWPLPESQEARIKLSRSKLSGFRDQHRALDSDSATDRREGAVAGIEDPDVAHRLSNPLRSADQLRIATGRFHHTANPSVEHRNDLG